MENLLGSTLLDRYFLRESVGSGGMADVYLAWDKLRSARMAVKVLRRDLATSPRFFQMFAKEAELLRKLEHPNIVRLYEFDKEDDIAFIVMDWIEGTNLRQAIVDRKKPFAMDEVGYILGPVCSALNYAHQNNVYHCDVKPANILLHVDGRVFLTDFGVARLASERIGGGTPPYMSPEQFSGNEVTAQADIYALGITIYEMLSGGQVPFRGESASSQGSTTRDRIAWEHSNAPLPSITAYNSNLPASIESLLIKALNKETNQRFASAMDLREAFELARQQRRENSTVNTILQLFPPKTPPPVNRPAAQSPAQPARPAPPARKIGPRQAPPPPGPSPTMKKLKKVLKDLNDLSKNSLASIPGRPSQPASSGGAPYLLTRSGDLQGQVIRVITQSLSIGRSSQSQVRLNESSVSRMHSTLILTRKGVYIRDENSSMGTYVNGKRISGPTLLRHGDVIQIGYYQVFEFRER